MCLSNKIINNQNISIMRKNFLLLMLMALLPLAGWAADLDPAKIVIGNRSYGSIDALSVSTTYNQTTEISIDQTHFYQKEDLTDEPSTAAISTLTAGKYYLKVTGIGIYEGQTAVASFWVYPAKLVIDFDAKSKTYGEAEPTIEYSLTYKTGGSVFANTGNVLGLTVGRVEGTNVGNYDFTFSITNTNYELTRDGDTDTDQFTIDPKDISGTIGVTLAAADLTYNGANQNPTIKVKEGDKEIDLEQFDVQYSSDGGSSWGTAHANAGTYKVKVVAKSGKNYAGTADKEATTTFEIKKAPLSIYVNDVEKTYNRDDVIPAVTYGYSGLQGNDATNPQPFGTSAFTPDYNTTGDIYVGTYLLKPVQDTPTSNINNYEVTYLATGKLTVKKKAITIKPDDGTKDFSAADPAFTVDASAAISEDQSTIKSCYDVTRTNTAEAVGVYNNVLELTKKSGLTAAHEKVLAQYDITLGKGKFTINAATLYVFPKNITITYGDDAPALEVVATNSSGNPVELTTTPTVKFKELSETPTDAGTYVLTLDGEAAATGYATVVKLDGQYTINKKALTITPKAQTLHVGDKMAALATYNINNSKVELDGVVGNDVIGYELRFDNDVLGTAVNTKSTSDITDDELIAAGDYPAAIKVATIASTTEKPNANANYTITTGTANLKVVAAGTFVLDDSDTDLAAKIQAANNATKAIAFTSRVLKAGQWNTLVLPFETNVTELSEKLGYAVVDMLAPSDSPSKIYLKLAFGAIPANTPFLVQPATDKDLATVTFSGKTIVYSANPKVDDTKGHEFIGTYVTGKNVTKDDTTEYYYSSSEKKFVNSANKTNIGIMRAYLKDNSVAGVRAITIQEPNGTESTTAIGDFSVETKVVNEGWYNLNGVKVQGVPTEKGIYIRNGKKIVVK